MIFHYTYPPPLRPLTAKAHELPSSPRLVLPPDADPLLPPPLHASPRPLHLLGRYRWIGRTISICGIKGYVAVPTGLRLVCSCARLHGGQHGVHLLLPPQLEEDDVGLSDRVQVKHPVKRVSLVSNGMPQRVRSRRRYCSTGWKGPTAVTGDGLRRVRETCSWKEKMFASFASPSCSHVSRLLRTILRGIHPSCSKPSSSITPRARSYQTTLLNPDAPSFGDEDPLEGVRDAGVDVTKVEVDRSVN